MKSATTTSSSAVAVLLLLLAVAVAAVRSNVIANHDDTFAYGDNELDELEVGGPPLDHAKIARDIVHKAGESNVLSLSIQNPIRKRFSVIGFRG